MKKECISHTIHMTVLNDDDFLSRYCGDKPVISDEVAGYLNNSIKAIPPKELKGLSIEIKSDVITEEEAAQYNDAVKNYYGNEMTRLSFDLKRLKRSAAAMFFFGAAILAFMIAVSVSGKERVIYEILDIAGWVFVWEAVDLFFFERFKTKHEYFRAKALSEATIHYLPNAEI